jgi:hypothetical protein
MPLRTALNRFLDILIIEIGDLENDLIDLIQLAQDRLQRHEITNYVFLENKGLLLNEMSCLKTLMDALRPLDTSRYSDVKEMMADLQERIRKRAEECGYPEVVFNLVKRRIDKVYRYLTEED